MSTTRERREGSLELRLQWKTKGVTKSRENWGKKRCEIFIADSGGNVAELLDIVLI